MKRFFLFLILFITIILFLPTMIVLVFAPREHSSVGTSPHIFVKHADSGEITEESIEEYLIGVVAAEMPASFHNEAIRAQAVAARTYIYNKASTGEKNVDHPDATVCTDSTHCKAWLSDSEMHNKLGEDWYKNYYKKIAASVQDTCGEIITYNHEPIVAVFHSTGSGRTENSVDVWGGDLPYLKSVESPGDMDSPKFTSTVTIPKHEITSKLGVTDLHVYDYQRSEGGAVLSVNIGGFLFRGADLRKYFSLNSANFTIEETESDFIFHVVGSGHGVGLSQYGANHLAEEGKNYTEILTTYYTNVSIEKAW
ncbi:MAG: stage II sporulation protein D [Clostridia bacterium]|nr:stage II sporulation protein D [Clostridia bacterium]